MALPTSLPSTLRTLPSKLRSVPTTVLTLDHSARMYLRRNTQTLSLLSDSLRTLSLLSSAPHAELRAEAAATVASLLLFYRDLPPPASVPRVPVALLSLLRAVQLLVEMLVATHLGRAAQLSAVTALEAAKLALRLSLLVNRASQGRVLSAGDQALPEAAAPPVCTCAAADVPAAKLVAVRDGPRSGRKILSSGAPNRLAAARIEGVGPLPDALRNPPVDSDPILDALFLVAYERRANWVVRMFVPDVACEACAKTRVESSATGLGESVEGIRRAYGSLKPGELAAEVAYVARPLLHLLLIRRFGWKSWKAWTAALVMDLASRAAMAPPTDDSDRDERKRRMAQLILYMGRSPMFDLVMRSFIRRVTSPLRCVPLVGGAASSAIEWATMLQQYWFYTSGS